MRKEVYADYSATSPIRPEVLEAMWPYLKEDYGNPSSLYSKGRRAKYAIEEARKKIAKVINADPDEIYFTSGGTEADNWVIKGIAEKFPTSPIVTTKIEHHALLHACDYVSDVSLGTMLDVYYLENTKDGTVLFRDDSECLLEFPSIVSIMAANNEIGTIEPFWNFGKVCDGNGIRFHMDAVQAFGKIPIDVKKQKID